MLEITATKADHNTALVSNDQYGNVQVALNGNLAVLPASTVWTIVYSGGRGGKDTFTNTTSLSEVTVRNGGNNHFVGGTSWNLAYLWGNNNFFDSSGGASEVYALRLEQQHHPDAPVALFQYTFVGVVNVPSSFALSTEADYDWLLKTRMRHRGLDHGPPVGFPKLRASHSWMAHAPRNGDPLLKTCSD